MTAFFENIRLLQSLSIQIMYPIESKKKISETNFHFFQLCLDMSSG